MFIKLHTYMFLIHNLKIFIIKQIMDKEFWLLDTFLLYVGK